MFLHISDARPAGCFHFLLRCVVQTGFKVWRCNFWQGGRAVTSLTVYYLADTSSLSGLLFCREALQRLCSDMDPRCWRWSDNNKCFTLLNGVDANDRAGCTELSRFASLLSEQEQKNKLFVLR